MKQIINLLKEKWIQTILILLGASFITGAVIAISGNNEIAMPLVFIPIIAFSVGCYIVMMWRIWFDPYEMSFPINLIMGALIYALIDFSIGIWLNISTGFLKSVVGIHPIPGALETMIRWEILMPIIAIAPVGVEIVARVKDKKGKRDSEESKTKIPKTPNKKSPKIQSLKEQQKRLKEWEDLLSEIPRTEVVKSGDKIYDTFVKDNLEELFKGTFVLRVSNIPATLHDEGPYMIVYFVFDNEGVRVEYDGNLEDYPEVDSPEADMLYKVYKKKRRISRLWEGGYNRIIEILEEAFRERVPEPPENK